MFGNLHTMDLSKSKTKPICFGAVTSGAGLMLRSLLLDMKVLPSMAKLELRQQGHTSLYGRRRYRTFDPSLIRTVLCH